MAGLQRTTAAAKAPDIDFKEDDMSYDYGTQERASSNIPGKCLIISLRICHTQQILEADISKLR